jgi:hypothetical protein
MGYLKDSVDESMLGNDMSLKGKIIKDREKYFEKKRFKEKKETRGILQIEC